MLSESEGRLALDGSVTFTASVENWSEKALRNTRLVITQAAQDSAERMTTPRSKGGLMPVDTGFLRASMVTSINVAVPMREGARPESRSASYSLNLDASLATLATFEIGDTIYMTFVAEYARAQEYRNMFVRDAAMNWPLAVEGVAARLVDE